jgi:processing peptidase subunit alpha
VCLNYPSQTEKLTLRQSTDKHSDTEMTTLIDSLGSQISCASSRETIMYQSSIFPHHLPTALSILSSTILHPLLLPAEVESQKQAAAYEIREIWSKPELILPEVLHTVAYKGNTLGMPLLCPEEQLAVLGEREVRGFMDEWYKPERMVLAGSGMAHEELVELGEKYFGGLASEAQASAPVAGVGSGSGSGLKGARDTPIQVGRKNFATVSSVPADSAHERIASQRAVYTGGEEYIEKPEEEFVHLYIGFEGLGIHDPDIVSPICVYTC